MGWAAGGETPRGGRYYGSQSAHSFFAQQLRALQKMPLPGLHFPLPSWTDLSSATHVALVVGFRRSAALFFESRSSKQSPGVTLPLAPTIAVPTSRSLIACLILVDPSETVLEARVMYNHGDATRLLIKPSLKCRLICLWNFRGLNYARRYARG